MKHLENCYSLSKEVFITNDDDLQKFCGIKIDVLKKHVLRKKKQTRGNQIPFITKDLSKSIMNSSRLHNNFRKN